MYFYSSANQKRQLDGQLVRSRAPDGRPNDVVDIGVVKLGRTGRPPFPDVNKFAMSLDYLKPRRLPRTGRHYVIIGYPETKNRFRVAHRDVVAAPYAYRTDPIPESSYESHGVSPASHVVLPLDLRRAFDTANRPIHFPKPQGMSGSPVVVLHELEGEARVFPVVAVGIEYRRTERVLIATDVQFVLDALRHAA
jgi:hypothetical protein